MENNNKTSIPFIIYLIPLFFSVAVSLVLNQAYYNFQTSVFSNENTLLFVNNKIAGFIIFFSPAIMISCIILRIKNYVSIKIMKIKIFSFITILTFVISVFILVGQFFEYTDINKEEIHVRNVLFFTDRNYIWDDVAYAEVSYESGNKGKIDIIYNIYLNDGTKIDVRNSNDFFSKIVNLDNFMKDKKIKINRKTIQSNDYTSIENTYNNNKGKDISDTMQVVLQILNK
ncbi:hypothetical protein [Clostridium beijerinckii]|uniref:hypothetical protein n=1 Tax=Clostridium beijerinckii TaxID=1520 RepID=UPI00156E0F0E|nr:hypothetical protein [Clostridium beijerinckii]NRT73827.1 hypothetical protein [Clostridium beijerinckii]